MSSPRQLRIFLASPGDVADERALALNVIGTLPYDPFLRGKVALDAVAWDKPGAGTPMLATMTPQEAIARGLPKPSDCDIVVAVFWSRMGTLLPEDWEEKTEKFRYLADTEWKSLDARYLSGTEWEYFDALQAAEAHDTPKVLVYRRTETPSLGLEDPEFDEKCKQWKLVKAFFASFRNLDGSLRRGCNEYPTPSIFEQNLNVDLRKIIKELLEYPETLTVADRAPAQASEPDLWEGSPFPGLRPFTDRDAPIFFGRGRETDGLIRKLKDPQNRFIAVVGASGSGKSSLIWAGLIPRLLGKAVPGDEARPRIGAIAGSQDWVWVRFTPGEVGDNPFMALANSLKSTLEKHGKAPREVAAELREDAGVLAHWVQRALDGKPDWAELLLFVDQFEELFTVVSPAYQANFVNLLARAITVDRVRTILTMRADFYYRCLELPVLRERFENDQWEKSHFPLMAPGIGELYEMITRPAERAGLRFEEDLPGRILDDTGTEPGALALMAFALAELYEAKTADRQLTDAAYESFGGVHGAIGKRADDTFNALESAVQNKLGDVYRELVEVDEHGVATRRRALLKRVTSSTEAETLVNALANARLLVTGRGEGDEPIVEVAHEALFRSWPLLNKWIQAYADDLRLRRQIQQMAAYWKEHGCDDRHRWPDDRAVEAANMVHRLGLQPGDLADEVRAFLGPLDRERMIEELDDPATSHMQRAIIGVRLSLLDDPRSGVGLREDGLPDIAWCEVPRGKITLEQGAGTFTVDSFYIARYPVTYVQYRTFLEAEDGFPNPEWWKDLWFQVNERGKQFNWRDNHPAENLCWLEAVAFSQWLNAKLQGDIRDRFGKGYVIRLPTEWEWQQAATGGNPENEYPWGPEWDGSRANTYESELSRSTAVGMYPQGESPVEALDMAGNVWEWCLNEYDSPAETKVSGEARRVLRGGSWNFGPDVARAPFRSYYAPYDRNYGVGVRLACVAPVS